jgi:anti-sigma regulatory factor (Ser/Thr protein kinase)
MAHYFAPCPFSHLCPLLKTRTIPLQTFKAQVSDNILTKVDRLFTNRLQAILIELLQNSRRAGASHVDVVAAEVDGRTLISITDNGSGIDDFSTLLHLSRSGWDQDVIQSEDAAGFGFFSLVHSGVVVTSKGKRATITKEMFLGQASVEVLPYEDESITGTRLTFSRKEKLAEVKNILQAVVLYGSTDVSFNGEPLDRSDFLEKALYLKEYQGVRIGVMLSGSYERPRCNFHGSVIQLPNRNDLHLYSALIPDARYDEKHVHIDFDVIETSRVRLQLPDRSSIVEDDQYHALCREARTALFEYLSQQPAHKAPFALYKEAHSLGVSLMEASPYLAPYFVSSNDHFAGRQVFASYGNDDGRASLIVPAECAVVDLDDSADDLCGFTFDVANRFFQPLLLKPMARNSDYKGYKWYDGLASYRNFGLVVDGTDMDEGSRDGHEILTLADSIQLSFDLVGSGETRFQLDLPFAGYKDSSDDEAQLFVTRSSDFVTKINPTEFDLGSAAFHLAYSYNDDAGGDSSETQEDNFNNWVAASIAQTLGGSIGSAKFELRRALQSWSLIQALNAAELTEVRLVKSDEGAWSFEVNVDQPIAA